MYVKQLRLVNIRSFKDTTIEFYPGINLLVGHNNSGKSTIIKSLYKLQDFESIGLDDVRKKANIGRLLTIIDDINANEKSHFPVFKNGEESETAVNVHFEMSTLKSKPTLNGSFHFRPSIQHIIKEDGEVFFPGRPDTNMAARVQFNSFPQNHGNFIYPFFSNRKTRFYNTQFAGQSEPFSILNNLGNITSKIQDITNESNTQNKIFRKLVKDILGFPIGAIPHGANHSNTGVFVDSSTTIAIENMGEGVVNILGLLVMLLTNDRKLYLIEEMENDIHPAALKKLLNLIIEKSYKNQFIISTHSNIVVKYLGIKNSKIFQTVWKPYQKVRNDRLPTSSVSEITTEKERIRLLESLGYDLLDSDLYKGYLIFEESSAEAIIRDFLIPQFCPALHHSVKTVAAKGTGDLLNRVQALTALLVYIHQTPVYNERAWVIADGEASGRAAIETIKTNFKSWPTEHFRTFSKENFEEFYPDIFKSKFEQIPKKGDRQKRQEAKKKLLHEVQNWIKENPDEAKAGFEISAAEVITILKEIEQKLK